MIPENNPGARMQVRSLGELVAPASCCVCGSGNNDSGYLDLATFIEYHGTLYLCKTCLYEAGETFGMFTPDEVREMQESLGSLIETNKCLNEELDRVRPLIDFVEQYVSNAVSAGNILVSPASEGSEDKYGHLTLVASQSAESEPESSEPVKKSGPSDSSEAKLRNPTFQ